MLYIFIYLFIIDFIYLFQMALTALAVPTRRNYCVSQWIKRVYPTRGRYKAQNVQIKLKVLGSFKFLGLLLVTL